MGSIAGDFAGGANRKIFYAAIALVFVLFLIFTGFYLDKPVALFKNGAKIEVTSEPSGAWIFLDGMGNQKGRTPKQISLTPGTYRVIVSLPGYDRWEQEVTVDQMEILHLHADLTGEGGLQGSRASATGVEEKDELEGVPQAVRAEILTLSPERQAELKAELTEIKEAINSEGALWTADYTSESIKSDEYKRGLCGLRIDDTSNLSKTTPPPRAQDASASRISASILAPSSFDWRNHSNMNYVTKITHQQSCGSCWAFASTASLETAINAYYNNVNLDVDLSEQDLVVCCDEISPFGSGCCGAFTSEIHDVFRYYFTGTGMATEGCHPYQQCDDYSDPIVIYGGCDNCDYTTVQCSARCWNWRDNGWKTSGYASIPLNTESLKQGIMDYGPITVGMYVYEDFFSYSGGIYQYSWGGLAGGHAVVLIGWGEQSGTPYWIGKNSWGTSWGENGFFRIRMGEANIDSMMAFAVQQPEPITGSPPQRQCFDNDGDGLCNWGIGPKPSGCPPCSDVQDDDDGGPGQVVRLFQRKPAVVSVNDTAEVITFEATDISNHTIEYGQTTAYGMTAPNNNYSREHETMLTGLNNGTLYHYRVTLCRNASACTYEEGNFTTSNSSEKRFEFAVIGDNRPATGNQQPTVLSTLLANSSKRNPRFYLSLGDIVQLSQVGTVDATEARNAWEGYTNVTGTYTNHIPFYHAVGNHDEPGQQEALKRWREVWWYIDNGNGSTSTMCHNNNCFSETTYWFEYGNSLFIALNSEEPDNVENIAGRQLEWLNETLKKPGYTHKFVYVHRPIKGSTRTNYPNEDLLDQMFADNNVTIVFQGHDHQWCNYTSARGVTYITTAGGGAPLYSTYCEGTIIPEYHYSYVYVDDCRVNVTMYDDQDAERISVEINKCGPPGCHMPHPDPSTLNWFTGPSAHLNVSVDAVGCTIQGCGEGGGNSTEILVTLKSEDHCDERAWIWVDDVMAATTSTTTLTLETTSTTTLAAGGSHIRIDHDAVLDFDKIPDYWIEQAKDLTIHYGTSSHGLQAVVGLIYLESEVDSKYSFAFDTTFNRGDPILPAQETPHALRMGVQGAKPDDYWNSSEGVASTRTFVDSGLYDFSTWAWCGEHSDTSMVQSYLNAIDTLDAEYPDIPFIYMTGHRAGANPWVDNNNELIRNHSRDNDKVVFDFADVESYDLDGNYYSSEDGSCTWCDNWCSSHPQDCVNLPPRIEQGLTTGCPHSHGLNCVIKGKAFWTMMAKLAGWNGTPSCPTYFTCGAGETCLNGVCVPSTPAPSTGSCYDLEVFGAGMYDASCGYVARYVLELPSCPGCIPETTTSTTLFTTSTTITEWTTSTSIQTTSTVGGDCHSGEPGGWEYCSIDCKCEDGLGDCDSDYECVAGTACVQDVGADYGFDEFVDVCVSSVGTTSSSSSSSSSTTTVSGGTTSTTTVSSCPGGGYGSGGYCWYTSSAFRSCDTACRSAGLVCDGDGWVDSGCSACRYYFPSTDYCGTIEDADFYPMFASWNNNCYAGRGSALCTALSSGNRLCACRSPSETTTTVPGGCHTDSPGGWDYCSLTCKCSDGEGDCDSNAECEDGTLCMNDRGASYGWDALVDVCESTASTSSSSTTTLGTTSSTSSTVPATSTTTTTTIAGATTTSSTTSTTTTSTTSTTSSTTTLGSCHVGVPGGWDYCSPTCKCNAGEGDCDSDDECVPGTDCVVDKGADYGWSQFMDVCELIPETTTTSSSTTTTLVIITTSSTVPGTSTSSSTTIPGATTTSSTSTTSTTTTSSLPLCDEDHDCPYHWGCVDGVCEYLSGSCSAGEVGNVRCFYFDVAHGGPSDWVQRCESNLAWTNLEECQYGCSDGVCQGVDCHTGSAGDWDYCSTSCRCDAGEGDCDSDDECTAGNYCVSDRGLYYGFDRYTDVCENQPIITTTTSSSTTSSSTTTTTPSTTTTTPSTTSTTTSTTI